VPKEGLIKMDKSILIKFCDMVSSRCVGRSVTAKINGNKISMVDVDYGNDAEKELTQSLPDFSFSPVFMGKLLKSLPDEELSFVKDGNKYFITKSDYISLIMDVA
jgi:hypothetical protein